MKSSNISIVPRYTHQRPASRLHVHEATHPARPCRGPARPAWVTRFALTALTNLESSKTINQLSLGTVLEVIEVLTQNVWCELIVYGLTMVKSSYFALPPTAPTRSKPKKDRIFALAVRSLQRTTRVWSTPQIEYI